jgi:hypothetical protein
MPLSVISQILLFAEEKVKMFLSNSLAKTSNSSDHGTSPFNLFSNFFTAELDVKSSTMDSGNECALLFIKTQCRERR